MEAHQEDDYTSMMDDSRNMIVKRKRTKRTRPSSPLALTMASTSSTTTTTTTTTTGEDTDTENPNNTLNMSTNSIEFTRILQENDEEDMANCLILLAQGRSSPPQALSAHKALTEDGERTSGFHGYECKTCNRGFSSFQALGGHRASHKKPPRLNLEDKVRPNMLKQDVGVHHSPTTLSLQIGSNQLTQSQCNPSASIKVAKIHECSICSAEFTSGQALGGHMRRHRSMPMATTTNYGDSGWCQEPKKQKSLLSLDLNLPAPIEDDHRETKLTPYRSKDQMIAFSNSSLIHCHL